MNPLEFNHISNLLSPEEVIELKKLYKTYHYKVYCYKKMFSFYKKLNLSLHMISTGLTIAGGVVGIVFINPIILMSLSGVGVLIQTVMTKKSLLKKIESCKYAYTSYQKILHKIKYIARSGNFDERQLFTEMSLTNDIVCDSCPPISNF